MMKRRWAPILVAALLFGCDTLLVEPSQSRPETILTFAMASADSSTLAPVFAKVDRVWLQFESAGAARDTIVGVVNQDYVIRVRVGLRPTERLDMLSVKVELRRGIRSLFGAETRLPDGLGTSRAVHLEITPIAELKSFAGASVPTVEALGDTLDLESMAGVRFETADTLFGAAAWVSENPDIVEIISGARAMPRGNGETRLVVNYETQWDTIDVAVAQLPVTLTGVAPADTTIDVGQTFQLRPFGLDRTGWPLLPGAIVPWASTGSVSVDSSGVATGLAPGDGSASAKIPWNFPLVEALVTVR